MQKEWLDLLQNTLAFNISQNFVYNKIEDFLQ